MAGAANDSKKSGGELHVLPSVFDDPARLVAGCIANDPAAARHVWDTYATLVRGLLRRTLGRSDVEDTVQDTFVRFFKLVDRLREPGKVRSFIVGVTLRVAREELRHRRVRRWLSFRPDTELPAQAVPHADNDAIEALQRLEHHLDRLDANSRIVFVMRFVEGMPTTEIAEVLNCSLATAKRRVKRVREHVAALAATDPLLSAYVKGADNA